MKKAHCRPVLPLTGEGQPNVNVCSNTEKRLRIQIKGLPVTTSGEWDWRREAEKW